MLEAVVADLGLSGKLLEYRAREAWEGAAGPLLARQSRPVRVRRGRMHVSVPSAVWRNQLSFMKQEIVARINEMLGEQVIEDLVLMNER